jgi:hypothetical protein
VPAARGNYLAWETPEMIAEWNAQAPAASYRWKIEWVLKEIFGGVKLSTSARDFGNDGFRMGAADAAIFLEDLKKAVKYTDDYFAKQKYDEDLFEEVSFYNAHREFPDSTLQGLKHGKNTIVITLIPKVDPDNPPKNYPDKRPMYIFGVNLDNGDIGFSDYPKD